MELYIAILGTITAVITVSLTNFFSKRNQIKLEERKLKESYYLSFIQIISNAAISHSSIDSIRALADCVNKLLLVANAEVVNDVLLFMEHIQRGEINKSPEKQNILLTNVIKSMRSDLANNKKINYNYPIIEIKGFK